MRVQELSWGGLQTEHYTSWFNRTSWVVGGLGEERVSPSFGGWLGAEGQEKQAPSQVPQAR